MSASLVLTNPLNTFSMQFHDFPRELTEKIFSYCIPYTITTYQETDEPFYLVSKNWNKIAHRTSFVNHLLSTSNAEAQLVTKLYLTSSRKRAQLLNAEHLEKVLDIACFKADEENLLLIQRLTKLRIKYNNVKRITCHPILTQAAKTGNVALIKALLHLKIDPVKRSPDFHEATGHLIIFHSVPALQAAWNSLAKARDNHARVNLIECITLLDDYRKDHIWSGPKSIAEEEGLL